MTARVHESTFDRPAEDFREFFRAYDEMEATTSSAAKRATDRGCLRLWELCQLIDLVETPLSAARELAQHADADLATALCFSESALSSWVARAASVVHLGIRSAEEAERSLLAPLEVSDVHRCNRRVANLLAPSLTRINHLKREVDDVTSEFAAMRGHMEYLIECAQLQEMEWTMLLYGSAGKSLPVKEWKTCKKASRAIGKKLKAVIFLLEQTKQAMDPSSHFWRGMNEDVANLNELSRSADMLTIEAVRGASNEASLAGQSEFIKRLRIFVKQFGRHHGETAR